jgi:hypothetical protein
VTTRIFTEDSKLESDLLKFRDLKTATLLLEYFIRANGKKNHSLMAINSISSNATNGSSSPLLSRGEETRGESTVTLQPSERIIESASISRKSDADDTNDGPTTLASSTASLRAKTKAMVDTLAASTDSERKMKALVEKCRKELQKGMQANFYYSSFMEVPYFLSFFLSSSFIEVPFFFFLSFFHSFFLSSSCSFDVE